MRLFILTSTVQGNKDAQHRIIKYFHHSREERFFEDMNELIRSTMEEILEVTGS